MAQVEGLSACILACGTEALQAEREEFLLVWQHGIPSTWENNRPFVTRKDTAGEGKIVDTS